jgi:hypothetical protein
MRIAAGIILIILGAVGVRGMVYFLSMSTLALSSIPLSVVLTVLWYIVPAVFYMAGGTFCLSKKYWRVCLASASLAVFTGVFALVEPFVMLGRFAIPWTAWAAVIGAVISTIFISLRKKEWQEIPDSVNREVSQGG